jgi:hypothetical protein
MNAAPTVPDMDMQNVPAAYQPTVKEALVNLTGANCWIMDWFLENMPLENKFGTSMYGLLNATGDNPEIYEDNPEAPIVPPESVLVFADSYGFATGCLKYAPQDRVGKKRIVTTPPGKIDRKMMKELLKEQWDMIIYAYGVDEPKDNEVDTIFDRQTDVCKCLLEVVKEIGENRDNCKRLAVLTCDVFAEDRDIHEEMGIRVVTNATLTGFVNTARIEIDVPCHHIDVEWSLPETMMPMLAAEVFRKATFGSAAVRILKHGRYVCKQTNSRHTYEKANRKFTHNDKPLPDEGIIGISGGNGAVALVLGHWILQQIVAQGKTNIKMKFLSRSCNISDQNMPQWNMIEELAKKHGVDVAQEKNDVSNPEQVYSFVEKYADRLIGYVHSAGVLADTLLFQIEWDKFETVWQPKNRAALHLHTAFEKYGCPISFFWMFSSGAVYGNMGQLNYSASNAHMDGIARHRKAMGMAATTFQWGAWGEVGMAANLDQASKKRMADSPMPPFTNAQGIHGMEALIKSGCAYGQIMQVNPEFVVGMTNAPPMGHQGLYSRCQFATMAVPYPIQADAYLENPYCLYRDINGQQLGLPDTQKYGLVYKAYVKPVLDPSGDDEEGPVGIP